MNYDRSYSRTKYSSENSKAQLHRRAWLNLSDKNLKATKRKLRMHIYVFFFFRAGDLTQSLLHARQGGYPEPHPWLFIALLEFLK
jgi:hypothetical protein